MNPYLLLVIESGPQTLRRLLERIPQSRWDERLYPDRFTPREVAAHLADWEPIFQTRMKLALESPGATVQVFDEGQMAIDNGYVHQSAPERLMLYAQKRAETAAWLRKLSSEEWTRTAMHPEKGEQSIEDQANLLNCHDLYHIEQLTEYLNESVEQHHGSHDGVNYTKRMSS